MIEETWERFLRQLTETVGRAIDEKVRSSIGTAIKANARVVFSETEAADFLKVSRDTLAAWRKAGKISFTQYPQAKADDLSGMYTYDLADLLSFRERYRKRSTGSERYQLAPVIELTGVKMREAA